MEFSLVRNPRKVSPSAFIAFIRAQVRANGAELTCVIKALRESEPVRLEKSAGKPVVSKGEHDVVRGGGRLVQSGDRKVPGTYRAYREELYVPGF